MTEGATAVMECLRPAKYLALILVALLAVSAGALLARSGGRSTVQAQSIGSGAIIFTGTVLDSIGAPPPSLSSLRLVLGSPNPNIAAPPYCAAGTTDASGNYRLVIQPYNKDCTTPGTILSLRVNNVPASQSVEVPALPGVYPVNFTVPVALGGQPLPTATPILPTLTPPALQTTALSAGCSQVVVSLGAGATPAQLAAEVANPGALIGIWHFDNSSQRFAGYFPQPSAPSDLTTLAAVDVVFICVSAPTSITAP